MIVLRFTHKSSWVVCHISIKKPLKNWRTAEGLPSKVRQFFGITLMQDISA